MENIISNDTQKKLQLCSSATYESRDLNLGQVQSEGQGSHYTMGK